MPPTTLNSEEQDFGRLASRRAEMPGDPDVLLIRVGAYPVC